MRFGRIVALLLVAAAASAPVALAFGFDDGVKPPRGIVDTPYSFSFKGRNGCPPYTFAFQNGSLPPGLTMTPDGVISGVPTVVGRYSFWVELRDSGCSGGSCPPAGTSCSFPSQRPFTLDIVAPLSVAAPPVIVGEKTARFPVTSVRAAGGRPPYIWQLAAGPDWLTIGKQGAIAGTPQTPGRFRLRFALTDQYDDRVTADTTLIVKAKLKITTTRLHEGGAGHVYRTTVQTNGGVSPFHWEVTSGRFPTGVRLNTTTGLIAGTPHKPGAYRFNLSVKDSRGVTSAETLTLSIAKAGHKAPTPANTPP